MTEVLDLARKAADHPPSPSSVRVSPGRYTLAELRRGELPPTLTVPDAGEMLGLTRSHAYELVKQGTFPAKVLKVGGRYRVITSSVLDVLGAGAE